MTDLAYRRVAGGPDPIRDVLLVPDAGPATIWRSDGGVVGRFAVAPAFLPGLVAAAVAAASVDAPEGTSMPPADRLAEHLTLDGASLSVLAGAEVPGPWGPLLAACRAAVDDPGEPVAAIALVAELPGRVRLEHQGSGPLELGFGALAAAIRWTYGGIETGYAGARVRDAVVAAGPGWSTTIELTPTANPAPAGTPVARASFSISDGGVWIPVRLEVTAPTVSR
jgi:hypothetical protein